MKVIVQAGGRGSRLRHHTWNKPKCLVSIDGKPILYHLFDKFNECDFVIIGDYYFDTLKSYLEVNPPSVKYNLLKSKHKGTLSGIKESLYDIDDDESILLIWSDLILESPIEIKSDLPVIITTSSFICRWSIQRGQMKEIPSNVKGIAGIYYFNNKIQLESIPQSGSFENWFVKNISEYDYLDLKGVKELGDFKNVENENDKINTSRYFNKVKIEKNVVEKKCIDNHHQYLIDNELSWYDSISKLGFKRIPKILDKEKYIMERIYGKHLHQISDLTDRERRSVIYNYLDTLDALHNLGNKKSSTNDVFKVYIEKTINRVESISSLIPNFDKDEITINGKKCKNIFSQIERLEEIGNELIPKKFTPIHGDPTFSNTIIDENLRIWLIDPRGYFYKKGIWGDPMYDFAKVYYSAVGGYDDFNRKKFKLYVDDNTIEILTEDPPFKRIGKKIFENYFDGNFYKIQLLHSLIWLSLTEYTKDNIDSVIASFYLGLFHLEEGFF